MAKNPKDKLSESVAIASAKDKALRTTNTLKPERPPVPLAPPKETERKDDRKS